ncbi:MAG: hypothetical protein AB1330_01600 [Bacillota bacterium]
MSERDWQKDWAFANDPNLCICGGMGSELAQEMLRYWLRQVQELRTEVEQLKEHLQQERNAWTWPLWLKKGQWR